MNSIIAPIADVVAWVITGLWNFLGPIFGPATGLTWVLSIVLLTMAMRLIMVPLFIKQMHTQRAMTALAPKMAEIRKKYKSDRETLNSETMKLYQEAGVNPLMGCLPVLLQMPIFFGLFSVLRQIATYTYKAGSPPAFHLSTKLVDAAQRAKIFGATISDVFIRTPSASVKVVIGIAVLISMATTYLTFRQSMKRGMMPTGTDNPMGQSQKMMGYVMPFFALTGLFWQFGLVLYWVTTNLWTLGQQYVLLRRYPVGIPVADADGTVPGTGRTGTKPGTGTGTRPGTGTGRPAAPRPGSPAQGPPSSRGDSAGSLNGKADGQASGSGDKPVRKKQDGAAGAANGQPPAQGGLLKRFGRGRSGAEPAQPAAPETKLVRQQRQRQSRSKRSGKR